MAHTEDTRKTLAEIAAENGWKYDTLWRKARRVFPAESWTAETPVPASVADALLSSDRRKKPAQAKRPARTPKQQPATVHPTPAPASGVSSTSPGRAKMAWPVFDLTALLAVVIYAHTALVWYEVATIFVMPGVFAGVILAAMKHAAVVVVRSGRFGDVAHHILAIAFLLDALAWYVHYTAFFAALRESRYMTDMGQNSYAVAGVLAAVVSAGAFVALFLIQKIKSLK